MNDRVKGGDQTTTKAVIDRGRMWGSKGSNIIIKILTSSPRIDRVSHEMNQDISTNIEILTLAT